MKREMRRAGGPAPAPQEQRRHVLVAEITEHESNRVQRNVNDRRENHDGNKERANEDLPDFELALPGGERGQSPDAVNEGVEEKEQQNRGQHAPGNARDRRRPGEQRRREQHQDADLETEKRDVVLDDFNRTQFLLRQPAAQRNEAPGGELLIREPQREVSGQDHRRYRGDTKERRRRTPDLRVERRQKQREENHRGEQHE